MSDSTAADLAASNPSTASTTSETGNRGWLSRLSTPITTTILAGIVTLAGTIIGTFVQGHQTLALEREKEQHELILKMISVGDLKLAQENIHWLAESGLITDPDQAKKILATKATPVLPLPSFNPAIGKPNGAPCGPFKGMIVMDGQCTFGGDGAVAK
jgi:hypothetical protein